MPVYTPEETARIRALGVLGPLKGERWWLLVRLNPARDETIDGVRHTCPDTITPVTISTNRDYIETLAKNGGDFRVIEVVPA